MIATLQTFKEYLIFSRSDSTYTGIYEIKLFGF